MESRPFVEISFMPDNWRPAIPSSFLGTTRMLLLQRIWDRWDDLVRAFVQHLVERYGIDEISQWYFEVWNEPNLDFWAGQPKQETYWELYDHTAVTIKKVESATPRRRAPRTAQAAWVDAFIKHCAEKQIPLDYVSTHVYANGYGERHFRNAGRHSSGSHGLSRSR